MAFDGDGLYRAEINGHTPSQVVAEANLVCPFSDTTSDEDSVAAALWPELPTDNRVGKYLGTYAGRINDDNLVMGSSSGGLTSWLLAKLLEQNLINGVIHVGATGVPAQLFQYKVSRTVAELFDNRKSRYAPVTMANVLEQIKGDGNRYAVVGVPCFITAIRHLAASDAAYAGQIAYAIGILCGHWKAEGYAESLGWQAGYAPQKLAKLDFRVKDLNHSSSDYDYLATGLDGTSQQRRSKGSFDTNWGLAAFQPNACNFCDDIFAETADAVFGDAWLPEYTADPRGTNVVLTRNAVLDQFLRDGGASGDITLDNLSVDKVAESQAGNIRHRRIGLGVRLKDIEVGGGTAPRKRVAPSYDGVPARRIKLIRQRKLLSAESFQAFAAARAAGNWDVYRDQMRAPIAAYRRIDRPFYRRAAGFAKRGLRKGLRLIAARRKG